MKHHWLNKANNENLIIFFCGWSFDHKPFENLDCGKNDIVVFYDYKELEFPQAIFNGYKKYFLITWSMGVYIAYILREVLPWFDKKIAINGTPFPIDDELGIPQRTFDLTLKYVDSGLRGKFQQNLFKNPTDYEKYLCNPVERSIKDRAEELTILNDFIKNRDHEYNIFYNCAIISDTDKIIPTRNQVRFWEKYNTPSILLDNGHFPFYEFKSWDEILNKCS